ncbi:MAG: LysR family transcriptional regulator [Rhodobacteraceae bacterium]|nr:LysR family transcriptional regulator [Paracoccaceae bacterium]
MTDRLTSMSMLVACVDAGSLSAGARKLGLPLATVSRRVADLETHLGAALLNRSVRGLTLTDSGAAYVAACRRVLDDVAEAERIASGEFVAPRGLLQLSAPIVFGRLHVLPVVTAFLQAYPEVDVRLDQTDRTINLHEDHIDAAVRIGNLPDSTLKARRIGYVRRVVCASPAYLAQRRAPGDPQDLADHDCISFETLRPGTRWTFDTDGETSTVQIRPRLTVTTAEAAVDAAVAGAGVTRVLSYQVARAVAAGQLVVLLDAHERAPWPVNLVYRAGPVPRKLRAFIDFAAPRLDAVLRP